MTTPTQKLYSLGQSIWYDNIQRRLLENGELAAMIARGDIRGVTSNPTIFNNAIAKTNDYDSALVPLAWSGWQAEPIFWQLAIEDIRLACDLFAPLYQESNGGDGYVSLEVSPLLARNTEGTLAQAKQLWEWVSRPNLMVKIPATSEGLPAIRAAIAAGINVNVTLIFSLERYRAVMEAYLSGLEDLLFPSPTGRGVRGEGLPSTPGGGAKGAALSMSKSGVPASVASFFVSRMDSKVDARLPDGSPLLGKTAIAYTKLAYEEFQKTFAGPRWEKLANAGARFQRPLWASTGTKNPAYPDTLYVDSLVGPDTVNTVPPQTLEAYRDHGKPSLTVQQDLPAARQVIVEVEALGISMDQVTAELEAEGVKSFSDAFAALLGTIDERRSTAVSALGPSAASVARRLAALVAEDAPARIWSHDPTLWTSDPAGQKEIRKRLGWLDLPRSSRAALKEIQEFAAQVRADGLTHTLLLGMGGSSLAPEVLSLVFRDTIHHSPFSILDSTDPAQVLETARQFPPEKTLYIVSSKSGGTAEVNAMFNYFWEQTGGDGRHFAAITDPGTTLEALANARGFRKTFPADPTVGGRFSALTHFGLVPVALMGIDLERLLERAAWMMRQCAADVSGARNPGLALGAVLGQSVVDGRDKLTFLADVPVAPLGAWLEQLIAESSGKQGKGIVVVDGESAQDVGSYGKDRLFVYLRRDGGFDPFVEKLRQAGHPALVFDLPDAYALGAEFYRWEFATAAACITFCVNAFDQPDVQDNKTRTTDKIKEYGQSGKLEEGQSLWEKDGLRLYSNQALTGDSLESLLSGFLGAAKKGSYVAINAYLPRNPAMTAALQELRRVVLKKTGCATALGFGPRFLHSTGQLHKGGPDSGLFLQLTADPVEDVEIPGQKMSFGALERAQSLGDYEALAARKKPILRVHLPSPEQVGELAQALK